MILLKLLYSIFSQCDQIENIPYRYYSSSTLADANVCVHDIIKSSLVFEMITSGPSLRTLMYAFTCTSGVEAP